MTFDANSLLLGFVQMTFELLEKFFAAVRRVQTIIRFGDSLASDETETIGKLVPASDVKPPACPPSCNSHHTSAQTEMSDHDSTVQLKLNNIMPQHSAELLCEKCWYKEIDSG